MRKILTILFMLIATISFGQFSPTIDTVKFFRGGSVYEIRKGTTGADSLKVDGTWFVIQGGLELDPVWLSDSSDYYKKTVVDASFQPLGTYMEPSSNDSITGYKNFYGGSLVIMNPTGTYGTTVRGNAPSGLPDGSTSLYLPSSSGTLALQSSVELQRYNIYSSGGNYVEVLADSIGVTASLVSTSLVVTIPSGTRVISMMIRLTTGFNKLIVKMDTTDMENSTMYNRWMPLCQAWREDTGMQLYGVTVAMSLILDGAYGYTFTINGLNSTSANHIRLGF